MTRTTIYRARVLAEIDTLPDEYLPFVLQLVHTLRESVTLKPAAANLRQGWAEAQQGVTYPIAGLWEDVDVEFHIGRKTFPYRLGTTTLDKRYNNCHTATMKTAISLPDPLFQAAEQYAQDKGLSRSELYAQALAHFLHAHHYLSVTDELNQLYAEESSSLDPIISNAQTRAVTKEDW